MGDDDLGRPLTNVGISAFRCVGGEAAKFGKCRPGVRGAGCEKICALGGSYFCSGVNDLGVSSTSSGTSCVTFLSMFCELFLRCFDIAKVEPRVRHQGMC